MKINRFSDQKQDPSLIRQLCSKCKVAFWGKACGGFFNFSRFHSKCKCCPIQGWRGGSRAICIEIRDIEGDTNTRCLHLANIYQMQKISGWFLIFHQIYCTKIWQNKQIYHPHMSLFGFLKVTWSGVEHGAFILDAKYSVHEHSFMARCKCNNACHEKEDKWCFWQRQYSFFHLDHHQKYPFSKYNQTRNLQKMYKYIIDTKTKKTKDYWAAPTTKIFSYCNSAMQPSTGAKMYATPSRTFGSTIDNDSFILWSLVLNILNGPFLQELPCQNCTKC